MDLKGQIKAWERDFHEKNQRKPSSSDIKNDKKIYKLYKEYNKRKAEGRSKDAKDEGPSTPRKRRVTTVVAQDTAQDTAQDAAQDVDSSEPEIEEVFPTPQVGGRLLGLFEIRMPTTPSKKVECTPQKQRITATPTSRRTPTYLRQRCDESSPFKQRTRRYRSISDLATNAVNSDDEIPTMSLAEIAQFSLVEEQKPVAAATLPDAVDAPSKKFKRKNKKVMRPSLPTDVPVTTSEKQNFKRLNIQRKKIPGR